MQTATQPSTRRAPTYLGIIIFKLVKGALFVALAITAYTLSDNDLPYEFHRLMELLKIHPANKFFSDLAVKVGHLSEKDLLWTALGTLVYSSFSLVEGIGLIFHASWACWLAIAEAIFFIPIEVLDLAKGFSWLVTFILVVNIIIVVYLLKNRERLFSHHQRHQD